MNLFYELLKPHWGRCASRGNKECLLQLSEEIARLIFRSLGPKWLLYLIRISTKILARKEDQSNYLALATWSRESSKVSKYASRNSRKSSTKHVRWMGCLRKAFQGQVPILHSACLVLCHVLNYYYVQFYSIIIKRSLKKWREKWKPGPYFCCSFCFSSFFSWAAAPATLLLFPWSFSEWDSVYSSK